MYYHNRMRNLHKIIQEIPRNLMYSDIGINTDFEENPPYQEGVISETYQRPDRSYF